MGRDIALCVEYDKVMAGAGFILFFNRSVQT